MERFAKDEKDKHKKLRSTYSYMLRQFEEFKDKRREHEEMMNERKRGNSINTNKLKNELKAKALRSE